MRRLRKLALWIVGAVALYALLGFFVAPPIVRQQLEKALGEQLGRRATVESVRINPFALSASVRNFEIKERDGSTTAIGFEKLSLDVALSSLFRGGLIVEAVDLTKPYARVVRFADGTYNFQDIVDRLTSGPPSPPGPPPRFAIYNIQLHDGRVEFDDRPERSQHSVTDIQVGVPFISSLPAEIDIRVAPRLSAKVNGAPFEIAGETTPFKDRHVTTVRLDLDDLELAKYLAYSPVPLRIRVPSGKLTTRLVLSASAVPGNRLETLILSGTARLERLRVRHADGAPLLALSRLSLDVAGLDLIRRRAIVTGLRIDAPEVDITRRKDGTLDLLAALPATVPAPPSKKSSEEPFRYVIEQIALSNGRVRFVDQVPDKPATLAMNELSLYVEGLGNAAESSAALKMRGRLADAPVEIAGTLALLPQGLALDMKAAAQEIDLRAFSPYSVKYAGYEIKTGKLSSTHAYVIRDRTLTSENGIRLHHLTFGEKVDSPDATSLSAPLAVALLKDRHGALAIDLPVSGSFDDPKFKLGPAIRERFRAHFERVMTAPFDLLGSQFGGGEDLAYLEFAAGSAALDAGAEAKLQALATALYDRPGLKLEISGRADPATDGAEPGKLAQARAQAARDWLVGNGKIAAQRVSIAAPKLDAEGIKDKGKPTRVDFALR